MKLGEYRYYGDGELLENNTTYTMYQVNSMLIEAYPEGAGEPIEMNTGAFVSLQRGNLEQISGGTPMS